MYGFDDWVKYELIYGNSQLKRHRLPQAGREGVLCTKKLGCINIGSFKFDDVSKYLSISTLIYMTIWFEWHRSETRGSKL